ncbi:MAG: right-handed parallel beta-helix repeat-containing protein [Methanobrevibacter sp.]|nr:right-handed parallel beta-helix repeat-containing protein [Methanobrevibacter sp.]
MNKKFINLLFIFIVSLFLISTAYASDDSQVDDSISTSCVGVDSQVDDSISTAYVGVDSQVDDSLLSENNSVYEVTSDLSNENIQTMFDNAKEGDTFKFTSTEYNNISLVVYKQLNIISKNNSVINVYDKLTDKAKSLGISKTFGFYFTSNGAGSTLSGFAIKAKDSDNAVIVDGTNNVTIKNNVITGAINSVLVRNSENITLTNNKISQASENGIQLQNVKNSEISKNTIWKNKRSGIETTDLYDSSILRNVIHHNGFNGISMYGISSGNSIKHNTIHNNTNGIFVNAKSTNDVIIANTLSHNRRDPECELGPDESGNGLLFGNQFRSSGKTKLLVKDNALIHNEQFQAKNNPENEVFKLDQNWFDSTDPENSFICPMLLAKILKLDAITIQDGIGIQLQDENGNPITDAPAFDLGEVEVNGNKYTARMEEDGIAKIQSEDIEPNTQQNVKITVGDRIKTVVEKTTTSGSQKYVKEETSSESNNQNNNEGSSEQQSSEQNTDGNNAGGSGNGHGNYANGTSSSSHISNSKNQGKYGTNSSGIISSDSSDNGENAMSQGDENAGSSSEGSGEGVNAYEIVPETPISKKVDNTSGIVILSIVALLGCLVYGYRRNSKFDE